MSTKGQTYLVYKKPEPVTRRYEVFLINEAGCKMLEVTCNTLQSSSSYATRRFKFHGKKFDVMVYDTQTGNCIKFIKKVY